MTIAGLAVGATQGYIYLRSEYPHAFRALNAAIANAYARRLSRRERRRLVAALRSRSAPRRRRVHLRRGNLAARQSRRQARPGALQAAAAGDQGPVRPADGDQQRDHAGVACRSSSTAARTSTGLRHRPIARHAAAAARREPQAHGSGRKSIRRDVARVALRLRRRLVLGPADPRGAGWRSTRRVRARIAVRHRRRLRGVRRGRRDARSRRHRRVRRHRRHARTGALRDGVLRDRILRQVHAVPDRLDARRRSASTASARASSATRTSSCSRICARR